MATATKEQVTEYNLKLTKEEFNFLRRLLGNHIVGPDRGPRRYVNSIWGSMIVFDDDFEDHSGFYTRDSYTIFLEEQ